MRDTKKQSPSDEQMDISAEQLDINPEQLHIDPEDMQEKSQGDLDARLEEAKKEAEKARNSFVLTVKEYSLGLFLFGFIQGQKALKSSISTGESLKTFRANFLIDQEYLSDKDAFRMISTMEERMYS